MKRIFLFLVTNLAVLALLSVAIFIIERVFGVRLAQGGLGGLLVFAAIFGFGDMVTLALLHGVLNTFANFAPIAAAPILPARAV